MMEKTDIIASARFKKGFTLSMIETALQVTNERVPPALIGTILEFGASVRSVMQ